MHNCNKALAYSSSIFTLFLINSVIVADSRTPFLASSYSRSPSYDEDVVFPLMLLLLLLVGFGFTNTLGSKLPDPYDEWRGDSNSLLIGGLLLGGLLLFMKEGRGKVGCYCQMGRRDTS